jgi:hypothetical protein
LLAPGTLSHITSHHTLPLPLQRHPTDETPIILPEPLPRAFLVCRVPTFRQDHRPFFLPILRETDRTLGDPHAEEGQLQLDFALRGGPPGVDVDQPGEKGGYCFGPGKRAICEKPCYRSVSDEFDPLVTPAPKSGGSTTHLVLPPRPFQAGDQDVQIGIFDRNPDRTPRRPQISHRGRSDWRPGSPSLPGRRGVVRMRPLAHWPL